MGSLEAVAGHPEGYIYGGRLFEPLAHIDLVQTVDVNPWTLYPMILTTARQPTFKATADCTPATRLRM